MKNLLKLLPKKWKYAQMLLKSQFSAQKCWKWKIVLQTRNSAEKVTSAIGTCLGAISGLEITSEQWPDMMTGESLARLSHFWPGKLIVLLISTKNDHSKWLAKPRFHQTSVKLWTMDRQDLLRNAAAVAVAAAAAFLPEVGFEVG